MAPRARKRVGRRRDLDGSLEGDAPAPDLEAFYRRIFLPLVRRACWRFGLSKEDARDVVQDAFVFAVTRIDLSDKPKAWLIQVVDHFALNLSRKKARRTQLIAKWCRPGGDEETGGETVDGDAAEEVGH